MQEKQNPLAFLGAIVYNIQSLAGKNEKDSEMLIHKFHFD